MERVLVTGGAGFIGSHLVDALILRGIAVDVVDDLSTGRLANLASARHRGLGMLSFHQMDVRSESLVELTKRRKPSVIFHLASKTDVLASIEDPYEDLTVNLVGTVRVLDAALKAGSAKVVFTASAAVYGNPPSSKLPIDESFPMVPLSPYGASKRAALDYLDLYRSSHDVEYTALVMANIYGPRQGGSRESGVISIFTKRCLSGRPSMMYGDGQQTRDFVYVGDVVDAMIRSIDNAGGLVVNIGTSVETKISTLYELIAKETGCTLRPRMLPQKHGEIERSVLSNARALTQLGWRPFTELPQGIEELVDWYRRNPDEYLYIKNRSRLDMDPAI